MMRQLMLIFRYLPLVLVFASILMLVVELAELWMTKQGLTYASVGTSGDFPAERIFFMSGFLRIVVDFLWNIGFAAVALAAISYLEKTERARNPKVEGLP